METITSVGEFLDILRNNTRLTDRYFYRGESQDFGTTKLTASLYRRGPKYNYMYQDKDNGSLIYKDTFKYNTWKTYLDAAMTFYRNISSLKNSEKQNFMAFCQHHGLSTPLLDISTSPLVALYFASQGDYFKPGRLYIFKRDNFIPFNDKILSYKYLLKCYRSDKQTYPLLSMKGERLLNVLPSIKNFEINSNQRQRKYLYTVINSAIKGIQDSSFIIYRDKHNNKVMSYLSYIQNYRQLYKSVSNDNTGIFSTKPLFLAKSYIRFLKDLNINRHVYEMGKNTAIAYIDNHNNPVSLGSLTDCTMLLLFIIYLGNTMSQSLNPYIPDGLEFYTHCTLNWGRVKAQKSYFIIQCPYIIDGENFAHSFSNNDLPDDSVGINALSIVHKPRPYLTLAIKNKHQILKRLNTLGINEMSLFMDKDSIADYVKNKYYN